MTRLTTRLTALVATVVLLPPVATTVLSVQPPNVIVVTGATVFDGRVVHEEATILAREGIIEALGPSSDIEVPPDAEVIDATGRYVIPGLVDAHVHFTEVGPGASDVDHLLRQFLFYGVTTVLNLGATNGDISTIQRLRRAPEEDRLTWPVIYATGGLITVPGSHPITTLMRGPEPGDWTERGVWVAETPADVAAAVRAGVQAGMDGVKIVVESGSGQSLGADPGPQTRPQMGPDLVATAVETAAQHGLPVFAHATSTDELEVVVQAGVQAVVHLVRDAKPHQFETMASEKIYYVPTLSLSVWADVWGDPSDHLTDQFLRSGVDGRVLQTALEAQAEYITGCPTSEEWQLRADVLATLQTAHRLGVPIVAGADAGNPMIFHGFSIHHELELMVEAGLTPTEALVAATSRPAEMLGKSHEFGMLAAGRRADLLVLSANPLADIRNTRTLELVIRQGSVVGRDALLDFRPSSPNSRQ